MQIWKYEINPDTRFLNVPSGAKPLTIEMQNGVPCIWVMVEPKNEMKEVRLRIIGTGHTFHEGIGEYVGTFLVENDSLVFHVFWEQES